MSMATPIGPTRSTESLGQIIVLALVQFTFAIVIWGGLLFWAAGTVVWLRGWIHLGVWGVTMFVNFVVLLKVNRAVLATRLKSKRSSDQWPDRILLALLLPVTVAIPVIGGLDAVRYQWSLMPMWSIYAGIFLHIPGNALLLWTMSVNPYLDKTVRIQTERGHHVITTGPYAFVRHPMYVGVVLMMVGIPLVLGSLWTFAPAAAMVLLLIVRTALEDRMLRKNLPGYEPYTRQTPYRLLPGIW